MEREVWAAPTASPPPAVREADTPQPAAADGAIGASARLRAIHPTSVGFALKVLNLGLLSAPLSWFGAARLDGSGERVGRRALVRDS